MKIKLGDNIVVISGKNRSRTGKVIKVMPKLRRITVEKINIRTKHIKKTATRPGEIVKYEAPIDISNVKLVCPNCSKAVRVGYEKEETGKKCRICKKCKKKIDKKIASKKKR